MLTKPATKALIVLGNNRSGTSALTRVLNLMGARLPGNLMPKTPDNPEGYWESYDVYQINESLLHAAQTDWHDDAPIPEAWFASEPVRALRAEAQAFLAKSFAREPLFVLKDPRICRLVPFWRTVLGDFGADASYVLIVRSPREVFCSLKARRDLGLPSFTSREKSDLLWLRMILEAEWQTRKLARSIISYDALLTNWRDALQHVISVAGLSDRLSSSVESSIDEFLSPRHRHHSTRANEQAGAVELASEIYENIKAHAHTGTPLDTERFDSVRADLDSVENIYAPLRISNRNQLNAKSPWHAEVLARVTDRAHAPPQRQLRVIYISHNPETRSHVYRVEQRIAALRAAGIDASWIAMTEDAIVAVEDANIVVIFREIWNELLARIKARCQSAGTPFGFDIDDLIFDRDIITVENFDYLRTMSEEQRNSWLENHVGGYNRALVESDFAVLSTRPLADAAEKFDVPAYVLPNGLDAEMIRNADAARSEFARKPSMRDGMIRIGYASGTPTHQKDFATIAPLLAELLTDRLRLMLTIVGHLDLNEFPELSVFRPRIEVRSAVPHAELFREYARFDVNLAPLECGNPFCEGKSELKYYEAALVEVPTIAGATAPYRDAIKNGETGFSALTREEWQSHLISLIDDEEERYRMGQNARIHAIAAFGPEEQSAASRRTFDAIARDFSIPES